MSNKVVVINVESMSANDIPDAVEFEYIVPDNQNSVGELYSRLFTEWKNISGNPLTLEGWGYRVILVAGKKS